MGRPGSDTGLGVIRNSCFSNSGPSLSSLKFPVLPGPHSFFSVTVGCSNEISYTG